jgi:hypothetical protein
MAETKNRETWLPLMRACYLAHVTPSGLYRLVALRRVRSRVTERGKVEFDSADCDAIRRERADLATA